MRRVGFPGGASGKEPSCQCGRCGFDPCIGKIPWRKAWQPTSVFLPGESHGQRSLVGYSPYGRKESDTTEVTQHAHTHATVQASYRTLNCSTQQQTSRSLLESGNI